ncbi:penicillin-binding transpeptidase domain-containing protein [Candidatus Contubernalis alkaliaceticus]|uniref:penicillin-binding transpeptidase domain-containing protein n=1 Tax=Candidatus Contubernalis alkaliaceticus TaxID=338645 RepID=UPI001F4C2AB2|nr:penicillin-binding transpeptidase domain-containing protein [Candidatus Contubernalis alkalaceticus]
MSKQSLPTITFKKRLIFLFLIISLSMFMLIGRLAWIQLVKAEELQQEARDQWNRGITVSALRGTIYDRNGRILAGSATAETVVAIPRQVEDPEETARALAPVLEMTQERLVEILTQQSALVYVKRKVDEEIAREVRMLDLPGIDFAKESKRFYPNDSLASHVLGFVGIDEGLAGLEYYYEEELKGTDGRIIYQADARGIRMPQGIQQYMPSTPGLEMVLTLDETIQFIVERELNKALLEYDAESVLAIAVDPKTGEVLALAKKPDYDPNRYYDYPETSWQITPIFATFEPGSTFKLMTLAASIEEGQYNMNESFFCPGHATVSGQLIRCWTSDRGGHGSINFLEVVQGSCNPGFITLGQRLGEEDMIKYLHAFGFGSRTGIDLPGEGLGILFTPEQMGPVELATTSFGQGVSVTPLQQVMAVAAMANGGNLLRPYIVKEFRDEHGNVVKRNEPEIIRQVLAPETSEQVTWIMETVVQEGSGLNAYIEGYQIAGKTGTAQKVGDGRYLAGKNIMSFVGFVPADDPQILLFIAVDEPKRGPMWASQIAAPIFRNMMVDILNYLNIPQQAAEEQEVRTVSVPDMVGMTIDEASAGVNNEGLILKIVGEGDVIARQTPKPGALVPIQTNILVYVGEETMEDSEEVLVPDLQGKTLREAGEILSWMGLKLYPVGTGIAVKQEPAAGFKVNVGSTVTVEFNSPVQ